MKNKSKIVIALIFVLCLGSCLFAQEQVSLAASPGKISLDIKGMDIVDVLKMLSTRAGINVVIGKNVAGRVTLFLKDVNAWDAFEIVLLGNDLAYEKKGDIYNIITQRDYELTHGERFSDNKVVKVIPLKFAKAADLSKSLAQLKTTVGKVIADEASNTLVIIDTPEKAQNMADFVKNVDLPVETRIFSLNYAQVEKINTKIQEALTKGVGSLKIDERTNKIAVTDYPDRLEEVSKIIQAFDEKTPQVLIDAQVIELKPSDKFEMGVDWDYWIRKYFEARASLPINTANTLFVGTVSAATPANPGNYKAVLDILRTIGDTKVLSSPRVMALNNQEAKIHVGTKEAYITSTTSQGASGNTVTSQTVNFVDTGIKLNVTPTINRDGFVTMKIKPEISDATSTDLLSEGQKTTVPIVTSSDAETTVMVKDGVTIIIGGLRKDKREKTVKKIPLVGDIPLVGFFFRSTSDNLTKTDLVILLTPHIMSGEKSYSDFSQIPPKEGVVAKMQRGDIVKNDFSLTKQGEVLDSFGKGKVAPEAYYRKLIQAINARALARAPKGKKGNVEVNFLVLSNGRLSGEPQVIKSSDESLNSFAVQAIKEASPFAPLPAELDKPEENFKVILSYE